MEYESPFRRRYKRGGYHCDLCNCFTGWSPSAAQTHERGRKHVRRLRDATETSTNHFDVSVGNGYCNVCKVTLCFTDSDSIEQHNNGRRHYGLSEELVKRCDEEKTLITQSLLMACMRNSHSDVVDLILDFVE